MENPEAPKRRGWSIVRKAQTIGVAAGILMALGMVAMQLAAYYGGNEIWFYRILWLSGLFFSPAFCIAKLFGHPLKISIVQGEEVWVFPMFVATIVNIFILFIIGTLVGVIVQKLKRKVG